MASLQTDTAIKTLSELYGDPQWLINPKSGQDIDSIFAEWDEALKDYSDDQIATACRMIFKYKRSSTFPRIAHILAELVDVAPANPPELPKTRERIGGYFTDFRDFLDDCVRNGYKGKICFSYDVNEALHLVCDDVDGEFPADNRFERRSTADLVRIAVLNGVFWPKLEAFLTRIVANNPDLVQITGGATSYAIPAQFDVNNTKRTCA
jgi:hypothetical protein